MLFNSFSFLFFFLPVVLAGYFWLGRARPQAAIAWLALASLFFYGYWDVRFLPLLLGSILFNFWSARRMSVATGAWRKHWLSFAVGADLALLAWFKYANFLLDSAAALTGHHWAGWDIVLPVGISFFTFTQIAFLVDCYRGQVRELNLVRYALFVSYFPHLIAGPVLHHREMMPQFADPRNTRPLAANFAIGMSIFVVGLAKKILVADNLSAMAAPVFTAGAHPQLAEAWIATLAYTFQLYFDFSGYSDMAIGLSRLFGVKLPLNFNSPYKARDISEFWRRWHMTLSRFLRDYLYLPLGGNRHGTLLRYRNLMLTMLLGGLWHGAAWTYVFWGGLHGFYLVVHHGWRAVRGERPAAWWGGALTFLAVMLAWVVFRAPDVTTAGDILGALAGRNGIALPRGFASLAPWFDKLGLHASFTGIRWIEFEGFGLPALGVAALLAFAMPNTQEIFCHYQPAIEQIFHRGGRPALAWVPSKSWGLGFVLLFLGCLFSMNRVSEFLYFQF